jgi:hypothetical protein
MRFTRALASHASGFLAGLIAAGVATVAAQQQPTGPAHPGGIIPAPDRRPGKRLGPFKTLAIRGVTVIDGTGAPPIGPMDVIVEGNRVARILSAGTPGTPLRPNRPPQADHEIDATGGKK